MGPVQESPHGLASGAPNDGYSGAADNEYSGAPDNGYSDAGSTAGYEKAYLQIFLDELRQDLSSVDHTGMESTLPCMLEEFALRLGSQEDSNEHQRMMYIVHRNSEYVQVPDRMVKELRESNIYDTYRKIARYLCRAQDFSIDGTTCSDEEDQEKGNITPPFFSKSTNIDDWLGTLEDLENPNAPSDPNLPILPEDPLEPGRAKLRNSQAYVWLIHALSCRGDMDSTVSYNLECHKSWVLEKLWDNTPSAYRRVSRRKRPSIYTAVVQLPWSLPIFIGEQEYVDIDVPGIVGRVITLTGNLDRVYAATCMEYMTEMWPSTGIELVVFLEDLLKEPDRKHEREIQPDLSYACGPILTTLRCAV